MMYFNLKKTPETGSIQGLCAKCQKSVSELLATLDDAYNVWAGRCPYCNAINLLSMNHGLRGYSSVEMHLVLPTDEEKKANEMPDDCPTSGEAGVPANAHGSNLGEFLHKLKGGD